MSKTNYYGIFHEASPCDIKPAGILKERLVVQNKGISSHFKDMGFPFDTPMWNGGVGKVMLAATICHDPSVATPMQESWWPYEQSAYLLDGLMRLGILLNDKKKIKLVQQNIQWLIDHAAADGRLGHCYNDSPSEWPMAVFFRAMSADYQLTKDPKVLKALHRHFSAIPERTLYDGFRHINNLEGVLRVYAETGDATLLKKAISAYTEHDRLNSTRYDNEFELQWSKLTQGHNFALHGVSFSESVKLPVMLYLYSGMKDYLKGAEAALADILARHEQIPGLPSSSEDFAGRDPLQGYETCLLSDFTWSLGYFLMASGKAEYADRLEKIIYNALPGSFMPDCSAIQYCSSPNQVIASEISNHSFFFRGMSDMRQYRHNHSAQCCTGNVNRSLPNFTLRSWMLDSQDAPVAALYAPSIFQGAFKGKKYTFEEKTRYPYEETIQFCYHGEAQKMPLTIRIPGWCKSAVLKMNGKQLDLEAKAGRYLPILHHWQEEDVLTVELPMVPQQKQDRYWSWFECGPLVYSFPVPEKVVKLEDKPISSYEIYPDGAWNYGIEGKPKAKKAMSNHGIPLLEITAYRCTGWDALELARYTPELPLFTEKLGEAETLHLVPYGMTQLRITAFPEIKKRKILPIYQVLTSPAYPYDSRKPMRQQCFLPEVLSEAENLAKATELQADHIDYYDLYHHFGPQQDKLAYLFFRFWNGDAEKQAEMAVSVSDGAEIFLNGKLLGEIEGPADAEFMAPFIFKAPIRPGYNLLMVKVGEGLAPFQYRKAWGAKVQCYVNK